MSTSDQHKDGLALTEKVFFALEVVVFGFSVVAKRKGEGEETLQNLNLMLILGSGNDCTTGCY